MPNYTALTDEELHTLVVMLRDDIDFDFMCEQACTQHLGVFAQYTQVIEELERRKNEESTVQTDTPSED